MSTESEHEGVAGLAGRCKPGEPMKAALIEAIAALEAAMRKALDERDRAARALQALRDEREEDYLSALERCRHLEQEMIKAFGLDKPDDSDLFAEREIRSPSAVSWQALADEMRAGWQRTFEADAMRQALDAQKQALTAQYFQELQDAGTRSAEALAQQQGAHAAAQREWQARLEAATARAAGQQRLYRQEAYKLTALLALRTRELEAERALGASASRRLATAISSTARPLRGLRRALGRPQG